MKGMGERVGNHNIYYAADQKHKKKNSMLYYFNLVTTYAIFEQSGSYTWSNSEVPSIPRGPIAADRFLFIIFRTQRGAYKPKENKKWKVDKKKKIIYTPKKVDTPIYSLDFFSFYQLFHSFHFFL